VKKQERNPALRDTTRLVVTDILLLLGVRLHAVFCCARLHPQKSQELAHRSYRQAVGSMIVCRYSFFEGDASKGAGTVMTPPGCVRWVIRHCHVGDALPEKRYTSAWS